MAAKATTIGDRVFPRQKDAIDAVRTVLHGAPLDQPLDGDALNLAWHLFQQHPGMADKAPSGLAAMVVREIEWRPGIRQRCFFAVLPDGGEVDWSYRVALRLVPCGPTLAAAARLAVAETVIAYRLARFGGKQAVACDVTGASIGFYDAHVDHAPPWTFAEILRAFETECGVVPVVDVAPWDSGFKHDADRARFIAFHDARAMLRLVHWRANLSMGSRAAQ